jgi:S1-C subfamily serine protease
VKHTLLFLLAFSFVPSCQSQGATPQDISSLRSGVISIRTNISRPAHGDMGRSKGTGFIIDKKRGFILTNRHVVSPAAVGQYEVTFFNGREMDALIAYADPWHDFAILKVDPTAIPADCSSLPFESSPPTLDQEVFIIGKNAGQDFSFQTGRISSLFEDSGYLPNQSLRISLNNRGGSSGSALFNYNGKVIGLIHSSNQDSFGFALPIAPIQKALSYLQQGKIPPRQHCGALISYYSLDHAAKFLDFPEEKINEYIQRYPDAISKCLAVTEVFHDSPAAGILNPGDIIWTINGEEIGPHFFNFENALNNAQSKVKIGVYRKGQYLEKEVGLYNLYSPVIDRLFVFGGAIFYEADDPYRRLLGADKGSVIITNILPGSSLYQSFPDITGTDKLFIQVTNIDGQKVTSLDDIIKVLPQLSKRKYFPLEYKNHAFYPGYNNFPVFSRRPKVLEVTHDPESWNPELWKYDSKTYRWTMSEPFRKSGNAG